jgi:hypothetical protein
MKDELIELTSENEVSRRRVCQAMSILGAASLSGCQFGGTDESTSSSTPTAERRDESIHVQSAGEVTEYSSTDLINAHNAAVSDESYTVAVEYQGDDTDPDIIKEISYKRSKAGGTLVSLEEQSTVDNGVRDLTQIFTPTTQYVAVSLETGEELVSEQDLGDVSDHVQIEITGSSLFRQFLAGSSVENVDDAGEPNELNGEYRITGHRIFDDATGSLRIGDDQIIREFSLQWADENGIDRWVELSVSAVGETTVDVELL